MVVAKVRKKKVGGRDDADPRWEGWSINGSQPPVPDEIARVYNYQLDAVDEIAKGYAGGAQVVFLDAPTGSGKSLIGELARRRLEVERGLYVCSTKSLQQQYLDSFPYARVLKGRTNYVPTKLQGTGSGWKSRGGGRQNSLGVTCADCDRAPTSEPLEDQTCSYCHFVESCPYLVARSEAHRAPVGVLNTSYLLAECNGPGRFSGGELVVADESDLLEGELLGYVELRVSKRVVERYGIEVPKKGSHMTTIRGWLGEELLPRVVEERRMMAGKAGDLEARREHARLDRLVGDVKRVVEREEGWVRDNDEEGGRSPDSLVLKPVSVEDVAERYLWRHSDKWLCMTGTLVSAEIEAENLGLEAAGIEWDVVKVPMLFDAENRRVVFAPVGNMTRKGQEAGGVAKVLRGVERVLERHPGVNVLVHTHTYKLAKETTDHLHKLRAEGTEMRPVITYDNARDRDRALDTFKRASGQGGGILVASSMDRGVDLPGELCRVQVVCKVPMASLGSRQVSERLRSKGGDLWYLANTVRTILQMCGRAVRGREDYAVTYVLDEHFGKVLKDGKRWGLWPEWWLEALEVGRVREYV